MYASVPTGDRRGLLILWIWIQTVMNHLKWVLGTQLFSRRAGSIFNHPATSSTPNYYFCSALTCVSSSGCWRTGQLGFIMVLVYSSLLRKNMLRYFLLIFFLKTGSSIASEVLHYKWTTLWGSWEAVASADTLFCSDVFLTWLFIIVVRYPLSGPGSPGEFWKVSMLLVIFLKDMLASPTCLVFILHWPCTAMKEN